MPLIRIGGLTLAELLTYARAFAILSASLEYVRGQVVAQIAAQNYDHINDQVPLGLEYVAALEVTHSLCANIPSLNKVATQIERLREKIKNPILPIVVANDIENLQHQIHDHLRDHYYYAVTPASAALYSEPAPFGAEVFERFPSAIQDLQDAGKCLALDQGTATVFHLMRVMEVGLKVLSRELDIPYAPSWESHLSQIQTKIGERHASKSRTWKKKEPIFKEMAGDLTAIKLCWRNPTMHIVRSYEPGEAREIFMAVQRFMQRMASQFKEKGRPIAISVGLAS